MLFIKRSTPFPDCSRRGIKNILQRPGESHQFSDLDKMEFYMKAFNKLFSLVVASVLVFSLAGCGDNEESKKFSVNLNGTEIAITYVYKGDKVLKQSSEGFVE